MMIIDDVNNHDDDDDNYVIVFKHIMSSVHINNHKQTYK